MPKFDILKPADVDLIKDCANQIRTFKEVIKSLLSYSHTFPPEGSSATGYGKHRNDNEKLPRAGFGSTTIAFTNDANDRSRIWYRTVDGRLYWWNTSDMEGYPVMKWYPVNSIAGCKRHTGGGGSFSGSTSISITGINLENNTLLIADVYGRLSSGAFTSAQLKMGNTVFAERQAVQNSRFVHIHGVYDQPVSNGTMYAVFNGSGYVSEVDLIISKVYLE